MFDLTGKKLSELMADGVASRVDAAVQAVIADVKQQFKTALRIEIGDGDAEARVSDRGGSDPSPAKRVYDYSTTPGTGRQSLAAWHQAAARTLASDLKRFRADPADQTLILRLMASVRLYAAAGDAFADIVVAKNDPAGDPLGRPKLDETRHKQVRALRADQLENALADAVLDAVADEPAQIARASETLERIIATGTERQVCLAAALLGQIGDPFSRAKLNRLADEIERGRWTAAQRSGTPELPSGVWSRTDQATAAAIQVAPSASARQEVLPHESEDTRRLHADHLSPDPASFYGDA